jgi:hypothetical protein
MSLKHPTIERYKEWCKTAKAKDTFRWQGKPYTKAEFDALHFGGTSKSQKQINTDIEEPSYGDLGQEHDSGHSEESGE